MDQHVLLASLLASLVALAPAPPRALAARPPPATPGSGGGGDELARALDELAREALRDGARDLIVVIDVGGEELFARGWGPGARAGARTPVRAGPLLSTFLSIAALRLAYDGELDLEAPLASIVPELAIEDVRVDQLLTHTSGLPDPAEHPLADLSDRPAILRWLADAPRAAPPGSCAAYSATDDLLLGLVLMERSGAELPELLREQVFAPAGMEDTAWGCDPPPRGASAHAVAGALEERPAAPLPFAADELCTTPADLVRLQRALVDGEVLDGDSLERRSEPARLADGTTVAQGRGIALTRLEDLPRHSAGGAIAGEHVHIAYYPTLDATVVLAATGEVPVLRMEARIARLAFELETPRLEDLPVAAAERARYVGEYFAGCNLPHVVRDEDGHLVLHRVEGARSVLLRQEDGAFVARDDPDVRVEFERDGERVTGLVLIERGARTVARRLY